MSIRVLIVEDTRADFKILLRYLHSFDPSIQYIHLDSGDKVLSYLEKDQHFEAIFLDLGLPGQDGGEVLKQIRVNSIYDDIPIFILSGLPNSSQVTKFIGHGASGVIDKNFDDSKSLKVAIDKMVIQEKRNNKKSLDPDFVVGVGASAGGIQALEYLFKNMPVVQGLAFVVVQHFPPDLKSSMDKLLARFTEIEIKTAIDGMKIERGFIYLIPPKFNLTVQNGTLNLAVKGSGYSPHLSVDIFFKSLAKDFHEQAIAVILSGAGSDGSEGVLEVSQNHGLVICQDLDSAKFDGMPKSALATNMVNKVLHPQKMGQFIAYYVNNLRRPLREKQPDEMLSDKDAYNKIFYLIFKRFRVDFNHYKENMIMRRIERRLKYLLLNGVQKYLFHLEKNENEIDLLYKDLLIGVTDFFRDPDAFKYLEKEILPYLFQLNAQDRHIRIWVAGCASGEEAYSIAMLLKSYSEKIKKSYDIKIFASDLNKDSLDYANQGSYVESKLVNVPKDKRERFFKFSGDRFVVTNDIRNMIVFASQNLLMDPPFTKVDMICCRNLLIYFKPNIQAKVISAFNFSLKRNGILFLGPSEGLSNSEHDFRVENLDNKVYKKINEARFIRNSFDLDNSGYPRFSSPSHKPFENHKKSLDSHLIIKEFVQDALILDTDEYIIDMTGNVSRYLKFSGGDLTKQISQWIQPDLQSVVASAIYKVKNEKKAKYYNHIPIKIGDNYEKLSLHLTPLFDEDTKALKLYVLQFKVEENAVPLGQANEVNFSPQKIIHDLELQLKHGKKKLNRVLEEYSAMNEELHSVNEELFTVNLEYQKKIEQLSLLEGDLNHLLQSTNISTIFLDLEMNIRRLAPKISELFSISDHDIGRPIETFAYKFAHPNLMMNIREVLQGGIERDLEPKMYNESWFIVKMIPYQVGEEMVGVLLSFVDISAVKELELALYHKDAKIQFFQKELDEFAYLSAHDLKGFLRGHRLHFDEFYNQLNDDQRSSRSFDQLEADLGVLNRIVDSLVTFSTLGQSKLGESKIDLNLILLEVSKGFEAENVSIVWDEQLPALYAVQESLVYIFTELIRNGLRYNQQREKRIQIGCIDSSDAEFIFYVRDNGIGICEEDFEKIFKMFKKLHRDDEFSRGQGVGLSFCKRHIQSSNGRIWVESEIGIGTVFYFSLPKDKSIES